MKNLKTFTQLLEDEKPDAEGAVESDKTTKDVTLVLKFGDDQKQIDSILNGLKTDGLLKSFEKKPEKAEDTKGDMIAFDGNVYTMNFTSAYGAYMFGHMQASHNPFK